MCSSDLLKPLAAVMIQDLDGRLNLNLHGDRTQGTAVDNFNGGVGFNVFCYSEGLQRFTYKRNPSLLLQDWQKSVPQGFGFGPADISLNPLFGNSAAILKTNSNYSIFDMRYGAKPYLNQPFNPQVDRWPGGRLNDPMSAVTEREIPLNGVYVHSKLPGAPLGRRSAVAPAFDRNGNLTFLYPQVAEIGRAHV